jgi:hypothetical protein
MDVIVAAWRAGSRAEAGNVTRNWSTAVLAERTARNPWMSGRPRRQIQPLTTFSHQLTTPPRSLGPLSPRFWYLGRRIRVDDAYIVPNGTARGPARRSQSARLPRIRGGSTRQFCLIQPQDQHEVGQTDIENGDSRIRP